VIPREQDPEFTEVGRATMAKAGFSEGSDGRFVTETDTPERLELRRIFRKRSKSYDFWIDNGIALVGSPDTVIRKMQEQRDLMGLDVFSAQHTFGNMPMKVVEKSIKLFGKEVIPAFS